MSNVPWKDLKYSQFYVRSVYCSWKKMSVLKLIKMAAKLSEQPGPWE